MITVGTLGESDRERWAELFLGYNAFYERTLPLDVYDRAWTEFMADDRMHARVFRKWTQGVDL